MKALSLKSNRLALQDLESSDLDSIHVLHSLPETDEFNTMGIPGNRGVTEKLLSDWISLQETEPRTAFTWKIMRGNEFIGLIGLKPGKPNYRTAEVWYKLHKDFWGEGYATEALARLLEFCFTELQLHRVEAGCAVENSASVKVLEKAGMIREGRKRKKLPSGESGRTTIFMRSWKKIFQKAKALRSRFSTLRFT